jgi:hypothetical protein
MDKRVEIFLSDESYDLSSQVNSFLQKTKGKLHDVKCSISQSEYEEILIPTIAICLVYTPETNED